MMYTTQKSKSVHGRSKLEERSRKLINQLDNLTEERLKIEKSLDKREFEYDKALSKDRKPNENEFNSTLRKMEKEIKLLKKRSN